jgi:hypothetical protein
MHSQLVSNVGHAIFYFFFSDSHSQIYQDLVISLLAQFCNKEPDLSMLRGAGDDDCGKRCHRPQERVFET